MTLMRAFAKCDKKQVHWVVIKVCSLGGDGGPTFIYPGILSSANKKTKNSYDFSREKI